MVTNKRNGNRKSRNRKEKLKSPDLGYYFIFTDTEKTEKNYFEGLRDSIPEKYKSKLIIKVNKSKIRTDKLVDTAYNWVALQPQYGEAWIVFDRDLVSNFDSIVEEAGRKNINVGWSNPCLEIWFCSYFGSMPTYQDSVTCCKKFGEKFKKVTKRDYEKSDYDIYKLLCEYGEEDRAIKIADKKLKEHNKDGNFRPSDMCPATTIHKLISEIKDKIK